MTSSEQQLTVLFRQLAAADQLTLLSFAEFLVSRRGPGDVAVSTEPVVIPAPEAIERPPGESVVAALKRLSKTYPMLDKTEMLGATSDVVASTIMQGTDPVAAVDQLESIFRSRYDKLKSGDHE